MKDTPQKCPGSAIKLRLDGVSPKAFHRSDSWPKFKSMKRKSRQRYINKRMEDWDQISPPYRKAKQNSIMKRAALHGLEWKPTTAKVVNGRVMVHSEVAMENSEVGEHVVRDKESQVIISKNATPSVEVSLRSSTKSIYNSDNEFSMYSPLISNSHNMNDVIKHHSERLSQAPWLVADGNKIKTIQKEWDTERLSFLLSDWTHRLIAKLLYPVAIIWVRVKSSLQAVTRFVAQELYLPLSFIPEDTRDSSGLQFKSFIPNFLHFMIFTLFVCVDIFLSIFTALPIRAFIGILRWLCIGFNSLTRRELHDLAMIITGIAMCFVLRTKFLDVSFTYHWVKAQSTFKLYVLFNFIRIFDHLCCALGQGISTTLFIEGSLMFYVFFMVYSIFHTLLMFLNLITLNVCMNSGSHSLMTLMVFESFIELKSVVFKKMPEEVMLQICCSDVVEHFRTFIMVFLIYVQTFCHLPLERYLDWFWDKAGILLILVVSELTVDLLKHGYLMKFNKHRAKIYRVFTTRLAMDVLNSREYALRGSVKEGNATALEVRMGLPAFQFGCFTLKIVSEVLFANGGSKDIPFEKKIVLAGLLWVGILIAKMLLGSWLTQEATRILESNAELIPDASKLNRVCRYTLIYKRIPV